jgi:hypothetical protein
MGQGRQTQGSVPTEGKVQGGNGRQNRLLYTLLNPHPGGGSNRNGCALRGVDYISRSITMSSAIRQVQPRNSMRFEAKREVGAAETDTTSNLHLQLGT